MRTSRPYWWRPKRFRNFGDELGGWLLDQFGITHQLTDKAEADLLVVGSTLDRMPTGWTGTIAGAGNKHETSRVDLTGCRVLALRGHLTAANVTGLNNQPVLGDPGLLAATLISRPPIQHEIGVVPHWSDTELPQRFTGHVIDVRQSPATVIAEIASCERIISSSLHGVVVADSYRIPRRAELPARATDKPAQEGGDFKWRDYASIYNTTPRFGRTWQAPQTSIADELYRALTVLRP